VKQMLAILLLCCCGSGAWAQADFLALDRSLGNNETRYTAAASRSTAITIPANGSAPAIPILGLGGLSPVTKTGTSITRFITSEGWGATPTVIQPVVSGMNITDASFTMNDTPWGNATELAIAAEVCDGIDIDGDAPTVTNCSVYNWRGDGITLRNNTTEISGMTRMPQAHNNRLFHCWTGIRGIAVDAQIHGNRIANCRDYGIYCTSGSEDLMGNHCFGAQTAIYMNGGPFTSVMDRFSDATTGFRIGSSASGGCVTSGTSEHCLQYNMDVEAARIRIIAPRIQVQTTSSEHTGTDNYGETRIVGIHLENSLCLVSDAEIEVSGYATPGDTNLTGSVGIIVAAHDTILDNIKIRGDASVAGTSVAGDTGVRVLASRTGVRMNIDATGGGFNDAGDEVVLFDDADACAGVECYVTYAVGDTPYTIPSGWPATVRLFKRTADETTWTEIATGTAQP
jgi:hypothetical protein